MKQLKEYLVSTQSLPILEDIYISSHGLHYEGLRYTTDEVEEVQYIGAKVREDARLAHIANLREQIAEKQLKLAQLEDTQKELEAEDKKIALLPSKQSTLLLEKQVEERRVKQESVVSSLSEILKELEEIEVAFPKNSLLSEYTYAELKQLYMEWKQKEFLDLTLRSVQEDLSSVQVDIEEAEDLKYDLENTLDSVIFQKSELETELVTLRNDPRQTELQEKYKRAVSQRDSVKSLVTSLQDQVTRLKQRSEDTQLQLASKRKQLESEELLAKEVTETLEEFLTTVDVYDNPSARMSRLTESILQDNSLQLERRTVEIPELPKSEFGVRIKDYLQDLKGFSVKDLEKDTKATLVQSMGSLELDLANKNDSKEQLLEASKNILKLNLFTSIKDTHEEVVSDLARLKSNMESENPSLLQFRMNFEWDSKFEDKKCLLKGSVEEKEALIEVFNNKVFDEVEKNIDADIQTSVIEDLILSELDPRNWYLLSFESSKNDKKEWEPLEATKGSLSNGERTRCFMLICLSILQVVYSQSKEDAPKIIAIDEGFNELDGTQSALLQDMVHKSSDLLLVTVPKGTSFTGTSNLTKKLVIVPIVKFEVGGRLVTKCQSVSEFEEFEEGTYTEGVA